MLRCPTKTGGRVAACQALQREEARHERTECSIDQEMVNWTVALEKEDQGECRAN